MVPKGDECEQGFGNYDESNFECELCDRSEECKEKTGGKKVTKKKVVKKAAPEKKVAVKKKIKKKVAPKTEEAPAPKKKLKKKVVTKKKAVAPEKKVVSKKKKAPKKIIEIKGQKSKKFKTPMVVVDEDSKVVTKEVRAKCEEYAERIDTYKQKAASGFISLVMKSAPLMLKAQDLLGVNDFDEWCKSRLGYERSVILRYLKAYKAFKGHEDLLGHLDGQGKLFAIVAHPEPVKYLEEHGTEAESQTMNEFRESVAEDRAEILGDDAPEPPDPLTKFIKFLKRQTNGLQKEFQSAKKLGKRKRLALDGEASEILKMHLEELNEWTELIKDVIKAGKVKK